MVVAMKTDDVLVLLNQFTYSDNEVDVANLVKVLQATNKKDTSEKKKYIEICKKDFSSKIWCQLCVVSKERIISATRCRDGALLERYDLSEHIRAMASALEVELKNKIFNDFNKEIKPFIGRYTANYDEEYVKMLKKGYNRVPAKLLVSKLEFVGVYNPKGISGDLANYLKPNWNLYSLSDKKSIKNAYDLIDIRNEYDHEKIEFDDSKFINAKQLTIKTLTWFIESMK